MAKKKCNGIKGFTKFVITRYMIMQNILQKRDQAKYTKSQLRMYFETPSH